MGGPCRRDHCRDEVLAPLVLRKVGTRAGVQHRSYRVVGDIRRERHHSAVRGEVRDPIDDGLTEDAEVEHQHIRVGTRASQHRVDPQSVGYHLDPTQRVPFDPAANTVQHDLVVVDHCHRHRSRQRALTHWVSPSLAKFTSTPSREGSAELAVARHRPRH